MDNVKNILCNTCLNILISCKCVASHGFLDAAWYKKSSIPRLTFADLFAKIYSASHMFISINMPTCQAVIRNLIHMHINACADSVGVYLYILKVVHEVLYFYILFMIVCMMAVFDV